MDYPNSYIQFLLEFHATRDFFECHELLEEYWKANPDDGYSNFWVAMIQVAVGQYHERRGNRNGGVMMYRSAYSKLSDEPKLQMGIYTDQLLTILKQRIDACSNNGTYIDIQLPLEANLEQAARLLAMERSVAWGISSDLLPDDIINRHTLRDRSDVIAAREEALRIKNASKINEQADS